MIEIWKPVKNFETLYEVSNLGNVRSIQFHGKPRIKVLKQFSNSVGYKSVKIRDWKNNISKPCFVHRLVAEAFIPNPENKPHVDHIDTDISNNNLNNLKWATALENQRNPITLNRIRNNIISYNKSKAHAEDVKKYKGKKVSQYDLFGNYIASYDTITDAALAINATAAMIYRVCENQRKTTKGFIFRYDSDRKDKK